VKRSENGEVKQASRIVTAVRRQAVAREKARITGKRARQPSALGQAAVEWERQREAEVRKANEEKLRISRRVETCPLSFQQVQLSANGTEAEDDVGWKPYSPRREKRIATTVTGRVNIAGVCALSRRLMAIERARALGGKPVDLRAYALEQAGRSWAEGRVRLNSQRPMEVKKWH